MQPEYPTLVGWAVPTASRIMQRAGMKYQAVGTAHPTGNIYGYVYFALLLIVTRVALGGCVARSAVTVKKWFEYLLQGSDEDERIERS